MDNIFLLIFHFKTIESIKIELIIYLFMCFSATLFTFKFWCINIWDGMLSQRNCKSFFQRVKYPLLFFDPFTIIMQKLRQSPEIPHAQDLFTWLNKNISIPWELSISCAIPDYYLSAKFHLEIETYNKFHSRSKMFKFFFLLQTYVGNALVSVNPCRPLPLYSAELVRTYLARPPYLLPPHLLVF